jgi:hypothetical protein
MIISHCNDPIQTEYTDIYGDSAARCSLVLKFSTLKSCLFEIEYRLWHDAAED